MPVSGSYSRDAMGEFSSLELSNYMVSLDRPIGLSLAADPMTGRVRLSVQAQPLFDLPHVLVSFSVKGYAICHLQPLQRGGGRGLLRGSGIQWCRPLNTFVSN